MYYPLQSLFNKKRGFDPFWHLQQLQVDKLSYFLQQLFLKRLTASTAFTFVFIRPDLQVSAAVRASKRFWNCF
jgi:hypothetical protein